MTSFQIQKQKIMGGDSSPDLPRAVRKSPSQIIKKASWKDIPLKKAIDPTSPRMFGRPLTGLLVQPKPIHTRLVQSVESRNMSQLIKVAEQPSNRKSRLVSDTPPPEPAGESPDKENFELLKLTMLQPAGDASARAPRRPIDDSSLMSNGVLAMPDKIFDHINASQSRLLIHPTVVAPFDLSEPGKMYTPKFQPPPQGFASQIGGNTVEEKLRQAMSL